VFAAAAVTTGVVTLLSSRLIPDKYAATLVGLAFLGATWLLVLRHDEKTIQSYGLSLGGLLEPAPLSIPRLLRDAGTSLAWVLLFCAVAFPPFWAGYRVYWHTHAAFTLRLPPSIVDEIAGQLLVIALPEEAFFRGFLQSAFDHVWPPRVRVFGADLGPGILVSSAIFAVGHLLTTPHQPARLAVFFPALLFGWLRARTRGIGAGMVFHATCNIFSATLARGYGLP
jgi:membrane protease YdiL (CAAX protease family)